MNWFETIERHTNHWDRKDANTLVLWFSGYKTSDMYAAETALMKLGGFVLNVEFDKVCGKTALVIREPKNLKQGESK